MDLPRGDASLPAYPGYAVQSCVGTGGMGMVYRAIRAHDGAIVAIKTIRPALAKDARIRSRFLREARCLARVSHANVLGLLDVLVGEGGVALVLEWNDGCDLWQLVKREGPLPEARALTLVVAACRGLAAIHAAGLVHRDVKPANIFLSSDGRVRLADLGLARTPDEEEALTASGTVLGTPAYLAPEQAMGRRADTRADVYAMGATLFALMSGRPPYTGASSFEIVAKVLREAPPNPRLVLSAAAPRTCNLIIKAMARDPQGRPRDGAELLRLLVTEEDVPARPASPRRWLLATTTALAIVGGGAGIAMLRAGPDAPASPDLSQPVQAPPPRQVEVRPIAAAPPAPMIRPAAPAAVPTASAWATDSGNDASGRWAEIVIAGRRVRLRWCPAGRIVLGSPLAESGRYDNEGPAPLRDVAGFWLAETPVDQGLWQSVMGTAPSVHVGDDLPVDSVTWFECVEFCSKAGELARAPLRLPQEVEWEHACRAGGAGASRASATANPVSVGEGMVNGWGLRHMQGNVWEWCADGYAQVPGAGTATAPQRVIRGGSWKLPPRALRPALRDGCSPGKRRDTLGFRLACDG